ncbi:MAG: hypothetical protein WD688_26410 [Candidatus Binatia bacterium]
MWNTQVLGALTLFALIVSAEAQDTSTKEISKTEAQVQDKQIAGDFSEAEARKTWILFLRKLTTEEKKAGFDWQPLFTTMAGALIAGLAGFLGIRFNASREARREQDRMRHEADLNRQKVEAEAQHTLGLARLEASTTYADKLLDLRLKQLEFFFAPLHALLEQSKGVYAKVLTQLLEDKENYREVPDPQFERNQMKVQMRLADGWHDWRMLDQMPPLKGNALYAPLIAEIIRIGEEMTALIAKYSAFSLDESGVSDVYGEYLAHFAILRSIHKDPRTEAYPPGQHRIGYYPRRLNDIVKKRYLKLQQELQPYLEATNTLLEELKRRGS